MSDSGCKTGSVHRCLVHPFLCLGQTLYYFLCIDSPIFVQFVLSPSLNWCICYSFDFGSDGKAESKDGSSLEPSGTHSQHGYRSSSNSNSSSICSVSSSSTDSDNKVSGAGDLEADADSLMCRQSGLSSIDQSLNDGLKLVLLLPKYF